MWLQLLIEDYDKPRCPLEVVKYFHSWGVFNPIRYKRLYGITYPHKTPGEYYTKAADECERFHKDYDLL